jgi:hypothetical protein
MPPIDWSQIGTAPVFERGNYLSPGRYKLRLLRCLSKQTQKSGMAFIAEFEVLESDNPTHPIGSKGTYFVKMANPQQAHSNIFELVIAVLGFDITNPAHMEQVNREMRPQLAGLMTALEAQGTAVLGGRDTVSVECRVKLTQRGTEFTLHTWSPWTPAPGWQPAPTPATASMPQRTAAQPAAAPQGYPSAYGGAPPVYAPPAFAPPALAPQAPAYPQAAPPVYAPQAAPPAYGLAAPPPWMVPR